MKGVSTALCFCYSSLAGEQCVLNWFHSTANGQAASGGRWEGREGRGGRGGVGGKELKRCGVVCMRRCV